MSKIIKVDDLVAKNLPKVAPALAIFYREDKVVQLLMKGESIASQLMKDRKRLESEFSIQLEVERADFMRGLEDIKEQTRQEGLAAAKEEVFGQFSELLDLINSTKDELQAQKEVWMAEVEADFVNLAMVIAQKLVGQELITHPDILIKIIKELLKNTSEQRQLTVQVNPEDLALIEKHLSELKQSLGSIKSFHAEANTSIKRGGVIFDMDSGILDAQIETQIGKLYQSLTHATD